MTKVCGVGHTYRIVGLLFGLVAILSASNARAQGSEPSAIPKPSAQPPLRLWHTNPNSPAQAPAEQPPPGTDSPSTEGPSSLEDFQRCANNDPWRVRRNACERVIGDPVANPRRRAFALNERAQAAKGQGSYADAIADTSQAIALDPTVADYYVSRAVAYQGADQTAKALADADKAIDLDPAYQFAHYLRGIFRVDLNSDMAAVADFTKAIELDRTHADAWTERGGAKHRLGEKQAAHADLVHAIGLKPTYAAYVYLGQISAAENAMQKAIDHFSRAITLEPRRAEAYSDRGREYLRLIKPDEAIRDLTKAIEITPTDASYVNRANSFLLKRQFKDALADAAKAIALNPRNANAYNARGLAYAGLGQKQKAISDYRTALSLDPTLSAARNNLARLGVKP